MVSIVNISGKLVSVDTMRLMLNPGDKFDVPLTMDEITVEHPDLVLLSDRSHILLVDISDSESKYADQKGAS